MPAAKAPAARPRSLMAIVLRDTVSQLGARLAVAWIGLLILGAVFGPFLANSFPLVARVDGRWESPMWRYLVPTDVVLLVVFIAAIILCGVRQMTVSVKAGIVIWLVALVIPLSLWAVLARDLSWYRHEYGTGLVAISLAVAFGLDLAVLVVVPLKLPLSSRQWTILGLFAVALTGILVLHPVKPPTTIIYDQYRELGRAGRMQFSLHAPVPYSPTDRLRDQPDAQLLAPDTRHWMGTEINGADVFSRMIHASRVALAIGFIATGIAIVAGCAVGGVMGYFSGRVDMLGMRLLEIFEAIPTLFLLISCVAFFGRSLYLVMVIIGLTSWSGYARFVRAEFLRLRNQDFVLAAIAAGLPLRSVLFRHMLPNGLVPVLVSASFGVASAILSESVLSFLGLGLIDEPSWGDLLNQATGQGGTFTWWLAVFPGLAIFLTVFSYNLIGEALRDALDPKLRDGASD